MRLPGTLIVDPVELDAHVATIPDSEEIITGLDSVEITPGDSCDGMVHPERAQMMRTDTSRRINIRNKLEKRVLLLGLLPFYFATGPVDPIGAFIGAATTGPVTGAAGAAATGVGITTGASIGVVTTHGVLTGVPGTTGAGVGVGAGVVGVVGVSGLPGVVL